MDRFAHLRWPFFEARHAALGAEAERWAAVLDWAHDEDASAPRGAEADATCRRLVRALGAAGYLRHCVPGGDAFDVRSIALLRDGFHPESPGGVVRLRDDGTPVLDYPFTPYLWDGVRRAFRAMAELQFAAGATKVMPIHGDGTAYATDQDAARAIDGFALAPLVTPVVSAHVMGGAPMGPDVRRAVVDASGRHHQIGNLYVVDGSLFPTSIGANPQLSIYAVAARIAEGIAADLGPVRAASR